jgi:SAM-dependent methyltransferase
MHAPPSPAEAGRADRDRALFDRIAREYCRKDLTPASRVARRQRLFRTLARVPLDGQMAVLEAGCGAGFSANYLRGRCSTYVGIDYSENLIEYARHHNAAGGAHFAAASIYDFEPEHRLDLVFMIGVLHHLADMDGALRRMFTWLKPEGWLAANEPQPGNPLVQLARRVRKRVDGSYSDDQETLSSRRLHRLFRAAGFVNVRTRPQGIISTPFAEVVLNPQFVTRPLATVACWFDTAAESLLWPLLAPVSWNLVAVGQRPPASTPDQRDALSR